MKTPVRLKIYRYKHDVNSRFVNLELHFQFTIDFDYWPGVYWFQLMVRDCKDDWWEEKWLLKKFWRSITPEYQREEDDPIPF
ncbi:hypothetical protein VB834_01840 [Limnoraphis robusta Tam1]|uniref:hypothetical protein n=1 Tax=Limnoraphis robusta TaxID=1118279 RepID=UPI002B1F9383|nr:hypothetical protein [Limnoraphis robusta]MEA5497371.1 hypothetical protein [Limnoraphis robusta BA-68 BA1]MEA5537769.1 hypothetical protein [Limnoraphis robusta Tam1]